MSTSQALAPTATPLKPTKKGDATRRTLLDSTIALIASQGYAATTTQAVLDHSGISRGSLLHQFKTRDALMVATGAESMERMMSAVEVAFAVYDDPITALGEYPKIIWQVQNQPAARALTEILLASRWDTGLEEGLRRTVTAMNERIAQGMQEFARANKLNNVHRLIAETHALISATQSLAISSGLLKDPDRIQNILDVLNDHYDACLDEVVGKSAAQKK